jgi:Kef-type K+ transport system membrane component KefB
MFIGIIGVLVPIAIGVPVFLAFPPELRGSAATEMSFALFLAVAGSITAISVVARALGDLGLNKAPEGSLAVSACAINDVFGWFLFTIVMSLVSAHETSTAELALTSLGVVAFVVLGVLGGAKVLGALVRRVEATSLAQPAALETLVISAGLLCGAVTQWLGIHAILGFFLAGTMAGSAEGITDKHRQSISNTFHAIFVPLFFATLGLKIDFIAGLEVWPTVVFCAVAVGGKFVGAWIGARLAGVAPGLSTLMGLIFIPGGAMEIVVATLALELKLIGQTVFVAIVFAALISSIVSGPLIGWRARGLGLINGGPSRGASDHQEADAAGAKEGA